MKRETEILLSAAFVLTPEENWTRGTAARKSDGQPTVTDDPNATMFCAAGALMVAAGISTRGIAVYSRTLDFLRCATGSMPTGDFNDTHTHAEVLAALYKAAEIAEAS